LGIAAKAGLFDERATSTEERGAAATIRYPLPALARDNDAHAERGVAIMKQHGDAKGFTLIEIMVVLAIVAVLATIAIPAFTGQMRKSHRAEAISTMQDQQLRLERWRVDHADFSGYTVPAALNTNYYTFALTATTAAPNSYTLTGTPRGNQASDTCGTLSIVNAVGTISRTPASSSCW
jgi:type IV pilus assembly protein PilE